MPNFRAKRGGTQLFTRSHKIGCENNRHRNITVTLPLKLWIIIPHSTRTRYTSSKWCITLSYSKPSFFVRPHLNDFKNLNLRSGLILPASINSLLRGRAKIGPDTKSLTHVLLRSYIGCNADLWFEKYRAVWVSIGITGIRKHYNSRTAFLKLFSVVG